jgi:hypothetical protein
MNSMNNSIDNLMPGQEFSVRVFPGKDGNIISRLPDGRPLLFGQQFIMTPKLRNGDSVRVRIIKPSPTYVLVQPIALVNEAELTPENQFELAPTEAIVERRTISRPIISRAPSTIPKPDTKRIDQFIETVNTYKCKVCDYTQQQRSLVERHIAEDHNVQYG